MVSVPNIELSYKLKLKFRSEDIPAGYRANLLTIVNSERKVNYIKKLLENQQSTPKHRWTKITPDPRFPQQNKDTPIFALGATRPILAKDPKCMMLWH